MTTREQFDAFLKDTWTFGQYTESEIERLLQYSIEKQLAPGDSPILSSDPPGTTYGARLVPQVNISTRFGTYRMDFVLHSKGMNTLIECDGGAFHPDPIADDLRSALILETGLIDQVIRFDGAMLYHAPDDAAMFAWCVHPAAFARGAKTVLPSKATPKARDAAALTSRTSFEIDYVANMVRETGELEVDFEGNILLYPRHFHLRYYHQASPHGRIARFLAILATGAPRTKQDLDRLYWETLEDPKSPLGLRVEAKILQKREALSVPLDTGEFYAHWDLLTERFPGGSPEGTPEQCFAELRQCMTPGRFARACSAALRSETSFPTIGRLLSLTPEDPNFLGRPI